MSLVGTRLYSTLYEIKYFYINLLNPLTKCTNLPLELCVNFDDRSCLRVLRNWNTLSFIYFKKEQQHKALLCFRVLLRFFSPLSFWFRRVIVFQTYKEFTEIWCRPLYDGSVAVVLFSRRADQPYPIVASFNEVLLIHKIKQHFQFLSVICPQCEQGWCSSESASLWPIWPIMDSSPMLYVGWYWVLWFPLSPKTIAMAT